MPRSQRWRQAGHRWVAWRRHRLLRKPATPLSGCEAAGDQRVLDVLPDFITARADRRTNSGQQVLRPRSVLAHQSGHRVAWHALGQSAPTRVCGSHYSKASVGDQDRHAVSGLHSDRQRRIAGENDIRVRKSAVASGDAIRDSLSDHGRRTMHLLQSNQRRRRNIDGCGKLGPRIGACGRRAERPGSSCEHMAGDLFEREAHQCGAVRALPPLEERARFRQYHAVVSAIIGLGIDATDIPRIAATIERYGDRFIQRIFTEGEIAYCMRRRNPSIHFAGRFAAKEAAMKALGTGHTQNVLWRGVEVVRGGGPPRLEFHGGARRRFDSMGAGRSLLTITHSDALAIAQVMLFAH